MLFADGATSERDSSRFGSGDILTIKSTKNALVGISSRVTGNHIDRKGLRPEVIYQLTSLQLTTYIIDRKESHKISK